MKMKEKPEINFFTEGINYTLNGKKKEERLVRKIIADSEKKLDKINIVFCTDAIIKRINKEFLKRNYETDVISFYYTEEKIGEIYISIETVKINSSDYNEKFEHELNRVIIHGALHVVGYLDYSEEDRDIMKEKEEEYLKFIRN